MAQTTQAEPTPGPNKSESERAVFQVLKDVTGSPPREPPVLTVGMVSDRVDFSRRTVHDRLNDLAENDPNVNTHQIGSAVAYWYSSDSANTGLNGLINPFRRAWSVYRNLAVGKLTGYQFPDMVRWESEENYPGSVPLLVLLLSAGIITYYLTQQPILSIVFVMAISVIWGSLVIFANRVWPGSNE